MKLFLIVNFLMFSLSLLCGNGLSQREVDKKEKIEEKKFIKMSNMQKIIILRKFIDRIIQEKADINIKHRLVAISGYVNDATLLEFAVDYYDSKSVERLLKHGANANINFTIDHDRKKPLQPILTHLKTSICLLNERATHDKICKLLSANLNNTLTT